MSCSPLGNAAHAAIWCITVKLQTQPLDKFSFPITLISRGRRAATISILMWPTRWATDWLVCPTQLPGRCGPENPSGARNNMTQVNNPDYPNALLLG